jgi:hypothetical protein
VGGALGRVVAEGAPTSHPVRVSAARSIAEARVVINRRGLKRRKVSTSALTFAGLWVVPICS